MDSTWWREGTDSVLKPSGTLDIGTYIDRRQATVAQWVALHPIFEVCVQDTG